MIEEALVAFSANACSIHSRETLETLSQPRWPAGSPKGGQFAPIDASLSGDSFKDDVFDEDFDEDDAHTWGIASGQAEALNNEKETAENLNPDDPNTWEWGDADEDLIAEANSVEKEIASYDKDDPDTWSNDDGAEVVEAKALVESLDPEDPFSYPDSLREEYDNSGVDSFDEDDIDTWGLSKGESKELQKDLDKADDFDPDEPDSWLDQKAAARAKALDEGSEERDNLADEASDQAEELRNRIQDRGTQARLNMESKAQTVKDSAKELRDSNKNRLDELERKSLSESERKRVWLDNLKKAAEARQAQAKTNWESSKAMASKRVKTSD